MNVYLLVDQQGKLLRANPAHVVYVKNLNKASAKNYSSDV